MNEVLQNPLLSAQTSTSYYPDLEYGDPTNSWLSLITLLLLTTMDILYQRSSMALPERTTL